MAVLYRLIGVLHVGVSVVVAWRDGSLGPASVLIAGVTGLEGLALMGGLWRRGRLGTRWALVDGGFCAVALLLGAWVAQSGAYDPWTFLFPYSVSSAVIIGLSVPRFGQVLGCQAVPASVYTACGLLIRPDGAWNVPQDLITYFGVALASWGFSRELRRSGQALDQARARALERQAELSAEQERSRYVRDLHDHVLQTLETLARGRFVADGRMRAQVTKEAFWLRRLVEGAPVTTAAEFGDLGAALSGVVFEHVARGMRVELLTGRLHGAVDPVTVHAVAAAVGEALTNVHKHAGVDHAVVRAVTEGDGTRVTVLDRGKGFDPLQTLSGLGLRESIQGRVHQVGGQVRVDSARQAGTCVEVWIPAVPDPGRVPA
jgi:signal transduction histidine kinase